jgi:hypothetical protein
VFLSGGSQQDIILMAFDFTHAFTNGRDVVKKEFDIAAIKDDRIYGNFPEFEAYFSRTVATKTLKRLKSINEEDIRLIIEAIPKEWDIGHQTQEAWIGFLIQRADYIANHFLQNWNQKQQSFLPFKEK